MKPSPLHSSLSDSGRQCAGHGKRNLNTNTATTPFSKIFTVCKLHWVSVDTELVGVAYQCLA